VKHRLRWTLCGVLALGLLGGCDLRGPTAPLPDAPVHFAISDAPRGGLSDFFWLPPTVPSASTPTGPFDAGALDQLAVEVCTLSGSTCSGSLLARFTSSGSPRIQLDAAVERYFVSWSISKSLNADKLYRVRVLRNGVQLGFIDVDVVKNQAQLGSVDRSRYVGVVQGQALEIVFRLQASSPGTLRINEIESSGGTPGDWIELHNFGASPASVAGYVLKDNDDAHGYTFPAGTTIAAGSLLVVDESSLGFGLGAPDAVRLFTATGVPVDAYSWTAHATTTYGRCPSGSGAFTTTAAPTKGTQNQCGAGIAAWPGGAGVQTADVANALGGNVSGLTYEGSGSAEPSVLWATKNGPGKLYRTTWSAGTSTWVPDGSNGWSAGKALRYPNGTGDPDAEGVTLAGGASGGGVYVATERNNSASTVSRNSILRFDVSGAGSTLTATHEWNLTADLPAVGSNTGLEAITWVPDSYLVARRFFDESKSHAYAPAEYPNHGDGLFFVGVEANGRLYAYALDHSTGTFTRVASVASGLTGVMGLEFDAELSNLWATCDDGCSGRSAVLEVDTRAGSASLGRLVVSRVFERPTGMANLNNEGFALAPQSECAGDVKPVFWADDSATGGFALRRGTVTCLPFSPLLVVQMTASGG
jgi:hypothetical protein